MPRSTLPNLAGQSKSKCRARLRKSRAVAAGVKPGCECPATMSGRPHATMAELEAGLEFIQNSPRAGGRLEMIARRANVNEREVLLEAVPVAAQESVGGAARNILREVFCGAFLSACRLTEGAPRK